MASAGAVRTITIAVQLVSHGAWGRSIRLSPADHATRGPVPANGGVCTACTRDELAPVHHPHMLAGAAAVNTPPRVLAISGFDRPESVLHDPEQDVCFVSSIAGGSTAKDERLQLRARAASLR